MKNDFSASDNLKMQIPTEKFQQSKFQIPTIQKSKNLKSKIYNFNSV